MAYDQIHVVDATSQMIEIALRSSTTGMLLTGKAYGDMTIKYQREGGAAATTVSVVTATKGSYTSGGFVETDIAGLYQFGIPNGAIATGTKAVTLTFACSGAIDVVKRIVLIGADLRNATSLGLSNLDAAVSSRSTYAGGDTSGTTTLLSRVVGTLATGTHNPQSGDAHAVVTHTDYGNAKLVRSTTPANTLDVGVAGETKADLVMILGTALFETAGQIAGAFTKFFNKAVPTGTVNSLPDAVPGTVGGLPTVDANNFIAGIQGTKNQFDDLTDAPAGPSAADIKTELEADGSKLDHLWEMTEDDGGVRRLTTNALEQAPTGAGTSDLDELLASHDTEDTLGNVLNDLVEEIGGLYRLTAGALAMAPGGGATTYSYSNTVDDGSGNLLDGVFVELATDSGMSNVVYTTHTNALGAFTVYSDVDGTHYLRLQLAGYSFTIQTVTLA